MEHFTNMFRINTILMNAFNVEYLGRPGDIGPPRKLTLQIETYLLVLINFPVTILILVGHPVKIGSGCKWLPSNSK